jgi:hypothetical protein
MMHAEDAALKWDAQLASVRAFFRSTIFYYWLCMSLIPAFPVCWACPLYLHSQCAGHVPYTCIPSVLSMSLIPAFPVCWACPLYLHSQCAEVRCAS